MRRFYIELNTELFHLWMHGKKSVTVSILLKDECMCGISVEEGVII